MSSFRNPVYYAPPRGDFKQVLGHGIARYGLFGFVNSDRVTSDMSPYVQSSLPPQLKNLTAAYTAQRQSIQKRGMKRKLIARFFQMFPAAVQTFQKGSQAMMNPLGAIADAFSGKNLTSNELARDSAWGTATVKTESLQGDLLWSTPVTLGSSSQPLKVNIDTGSADFFVYDPACQTCALTSHTAFLYQQSSTFTVLLNTSFSASYADGGEANGYLAKDSLKFGGDVTIPHQVFGLATDVSGDWQTEGVDGLMGLGPDTLSAFPPPNNQGVFTQLRTSKLLAQPVIGIALVKASANSSGEFSFGKINGQWIRGGASNMLWKNVSSQNFWGTEMSGIYVNNRNIMAADDPPRAIIDTGTSLMLVTTDAANGIHTQIPGAIMNPSNGIWRLPCSTGASGIATSSQTQTLPSQVGSFIGSLFSRPNKPFNKRRHRFPHSSRAPVAVSNPPNIFIELGAGLRKFGIPASDLPYQALSSSDPNFLGSDGRTPMCYSSIQSGADGFVVLGGTFVKNHYISLKQEGSQKSIGFGDRSDIPVIN